MKIKLICIFFISLFLIGNISVTSEDVSYNVLFVDEEASSSNSFSYSLQSLLYQVSESQITGYIQSLTSFGPRITGTTACYSAGTYIANTFTSMGLDVRIQSWEYGSYEGDNIEATLHGEDLTSDQIFIICAHYDSVPTSPGADDNAGGVAAVLAAAQIMSQYSFNNTVRFVAFSGEEQGLFGSGRYAQECQDNGDNIAGVLNGDMIGYAETEEDRSKIGVYAGASWIVTQTSQVSQTYNDLIGLDVIQYSASGNSDHWPFITRGYSAVMYHEYKFNPYYHSSQDTIDKMDINYAMRVVRLMLGTLAEIADYVKESGGGGGGGPYIAPIINFQNPSEGLTVKGTINITGIAVDLEDGFVKWVMVKIGQDKWQYADLEQLADKVVKWSVEWDTTTVSDGNVIILAAAINDKGYSSVTAIEVIVANDEEEEPDPVPVLSSSGTLKWTNIKTNVVVYNEFYIENIGDPNSILTWNIVEIPSWGEWNFYPPSGTDLMPEHGQFTVRVEVLTPNEKQKNFSGNLKIVNVDDPSNYVNVPITLTTQKSTIVNRPILTILERFPRLLSIFELLFRL